MTRIGSEGLLLLLLLFGLAGLPDAAAAAAAAAAKASEIDFYRDGEPRLSPEVRLERLVRFLEAAAAHSSGSQQRKQRLLELARQKLRGLLRDDMPERPSIIDALQRDTVDPLQYLQEFEKQRLLPYLEYDPKPRIKPYPLDDEARVRMMSGPLNKDPLLDYPETHYADLDRVRQLENARRIEEAYRHRPDFIYSFDKIETSKEGASPPFAVGPNDPRYYQDLPFHKVAESTEESTGGELKSGLQEMREIGSEEPKSKLTLPRARVPTDETALMGGLLEMNVLPEPRRRAEQDPLIVSLGNRLNDDIYFIAIVAGCSAAVMFALVLISLTWCRLQRMSKAAVDVEYPAYGVTGPNKDISPSGDQRLAQSAQMYHFQHHKQQIIAMEKASATRDPGSVSEAESDEENEEGDYTVYECPGLAPTGEMEVKNPLFHDDPTPATPVKSTKDGDGSDDNNI